MMPAEQPEFVRDSLSESEARKLVAAGKPISWARVVWVDRVKAGDAARRCINRWLCRPCRSGALPWSHNRVYGILDEALGVVIEVKVADIRGCSLIPDQPADSERLLG